MKTLCVITLVALCGCVKSSHVSHTWPDGSKSTVSDWRCNMKTEAQFSFVQDSNGVKRIDAGVKSSADAEAGYQLIGAGLQILKAAH